MTFTYTKLGRFRAGRAFRLLRQAHQEASTFRLEGFEARLAGLVVDVDAELHGAGRGVEGGGQVEVEDGVEWDLHDVDLGLSGFDNCFILLDLGLS